MTRRDANWAIFKAASVAGGHAFFSAWLQAAQSAAASHAHSVHSHAPPDPHDWAAYKPQFFSPEEFQTLESVSSTLIPTDDTPGAREAYVAQVIDFVIQAAAEYAPDMQTDWRSAMNYLRARGFSSMNEQQRVTFLEEISQPERDPSKHHSGFVHYALLKDMTVRAFYTSRVGLIDVLNYQGLAYLTEFPGCTHPDHRRI
jgi:hypothetical protein